MGKQRIIMLIILMVAVSLFIWIQFFEVPSKAKIGEEKLRQDPLTHSFDDVTQYAATYMGDASNTNGLLEALPFHQYKQSIEMDEDALKLTVYYTYDEQVALEKMQQVIVYNATAVFSLIDQVQEIEWILNDQTYVVTRDRVEKWFGRTLVDFSEPEVFEEKVQQQLDKGLSNWFSVYTESE